MASGDTKTNQYLDIAANGTRADLPSDTCCETRTQTLIRGVAERIMDVEDEVERLENNPDVADIVATYAELQAYDTSQLTDKDVIRVLQDETHDGDSTYYRWSTSTNTWTYIGESKQYTDFVGTDGTTAGEAGLVPAPAATDAGKFLKADGTWDTAGSTINVVQTTGTSTTDVMSQNATTSMIYADPTTKAKVQIGGQASGTASISIGNSPDASPNYSIAIGSIATALTGATHSIALGAGSETRYQGQMDISTKRLSNNGYNGSQYRLLTGLYDPQSDHDAATKGYVDTAVAGAGGGVIELTADDYNWPTANPDGVALWRLSPGLYNWDNGVKVYTSASSSNTNGASAFVTEAAGNAREYVEVVKFYPGGVNNTYNWSKVNYNTGAVANNIDNAHLLSDKSVVDSLTSTSTTAPLSANQGKILNDKIVGVTSTTTVSPQHWSALADSLPYNYQHTAVIPGVSNDTSLELVNDNPVLFAKHGFAIGGVTLSSSSFASVTIYSIGLPDDTVALNIIRRG